MKLLLERWRQYVNEELLNELSLEDVEKRFDSKKFSKAVKRYEVSPDYAKEQLLARIPKDITEKDKAGALNWLISLFVKDPKQVFVDPEGRPISRSKVTGDLELFFQIKKQNLARFLDKRSLSRMESVSELGKVVDAAREPYKKHMEKKDYLDAEQGKLKIFENDEYKVFIPTNKGAACELGKGTEWCTAAPGLHYYEHYHKEDDPLIIFKSKTDSKKDVQVHFGSHQFMDVNDEDIGQERAVRLASLLKGNKYLPKKVLNIIDEIEYISLGDGKEIIVDFTGHKLWYLNGKFHREDGPALESPEGYKEWYLNGKQHRVGGPAVEDPDGAEAWYLNGKLHREDGPAKTTRVGIQEWWLRGQRHRVDGPAIERADGRKEWHLRGKLYHREQADGTKKWYQDRALHREDGPAIIYPDGSKEWHLNGQQHREDGPAIEMANGTKIWYLNGLLHREDGPAIERPDGVGPMADGSKEWFLDGKRYTKEQYEEEMKSRKGEEG